MQTNNFSLEIEKQLKALTSTKKAVRKTAVKFLIKCDRESVIIPLVQTLKYPYNPTRQEVARLLGFFGDRRAIAPLTELLTHPYSHRAVRKEAAQALAKHGEQTVLELINLLITNYSYDYWIVVALQGLGNCAVVRLIEHLQNSTSTSNLNEEDSWRIASILAKLDREIVNEPLAILLKTSNNEVTRNCAAFALGQLGNELAIEPLIHLLKTADNKYTRIKAVFALAHIKNQKALNALTDAASADPDQTVRYSVRNCAIVALAELGALDQLNGLLQTGDKRTNLWIVSALRKVKNPASVNLLTNLAKDEAFDVDVRATSLVVLGNLGTFEPIIDFLASKDTKLSAWAAIVLGKHKQWQAVKALIYIVADKNVKSEVRAGAIKQLAALGAKSAIPTLTLVCDDETENRFVCWYANRALSRLASYP